MYLLYFDEHDKGTWDPGWVLLNVLVIYIHNYQYMLKLGISFSCVFVTFPTAITQLEELTAAIGVFVSII